MCDVWTKEGALSWTTSDDPYNSDSDCDEQELRYYKVQKSANVKLVVFTCLLSCTRGYMKGIVSQLMKDGTFGDSLRVQLKKKIQNTPHKKEL